MTKQEALHILIRNAAQNCAGVGQGIRHIPPASEKEKVKEAIRKVWPYNFPCTDNQFRNLGL